MSVETPIKIGDGWWLTDKLGDIIHIFIIAIRIAISVVNTHYPRTLMTIIFVNEVTKLITKFFVGIS